MNLRTIVWKELWERPLALATSLLAILLGVAALVAIRHVTVFSEREVARQLNDLGANILVLPQGSSLQDYYSADLNGKTLPEEHVFQIMLAGLTGVEKLSPRLCVPARIGGQEMILTGVMPQSDFEAQAAWQTAQLFKKPHAGCTKAHCGRAPADSSPQSLTLERVIERLPDHQVLVGAEAAAATGLKRGSSVEVLGDYFRVLEVLAPTGTVDDSRIFAHLHTVQQLAKTGPVVSAIEVLGCCEDAAGQLAPQLADLLPDSKVVTISQVVQAQEGVNRLMARVFTTVLVVLVAVGAAGVLGTIAGNVRERRREIGTLVALGATPGLVARIFLLKAAWLGMAGGIGGAALGTASAMVLGPRWAGVPIAPLFDLCLAACGAAIVVALAAAYLPARLAARLDPCTCFKEL
jgi:putative ABC transport system permease protein